MYKNLGLYKLLKSKFYSLKDKIFTIRGTGNFITSKAAFSDIKYDISGNNNKIIISEFCFIKNCTIYIRGNNHLITLHKNVKIYSGELWMEDNNSEINIGEDTTIQSAHLAVTENGQKLTIGKDCMLSTGIEIRTGDSHSIIDGNTLERINPAGFVTLEDHVWIGSNVTILKGVTIGNDSVVGTGSLVSKSIPSKCLAAGIPAKIIKSPVSWKRERI